MKLQLRKELPNLLLALIPFGYLMAIYNNLPDTVPTHFDANGHINGWSSKVSLWLIPAGLPLMIYLVFLLLPFIDPKQKVKSGVGKYERIKFVMLLFISAISCFTLYLSQKGNIAGLDKFLFALVGLFLAAMGNFFPALKPNYFIGIRSPWALENETVWRKTHQVAGKLWMAGGILIAVLAFIIPGKEGMGIVFLPLVLLMAFVPFVYSFLLWKKIKNQPQ